MRNGNGKHLRQISVTMSHPNEFDSSRCSRVCVFHCVAHHEAPFPWNHALRQKRPDHLLFPRVSWGARITSNDSLKILENPFPFENLKGDMSRLIGYDKQSMPLLMHQPHDAVSIRKAYCLTPTLGIIT